MDLKFEEINNWFVSEFEVTQDFNIHIEKEAGSILFYQRTAGSEYDIIHDLGPHKGNERIMDLDFSTFIYPKYIKIKSKVLPTVATITTNGEVHELVYQEKSVEITSNGTTKVTADTGYNALASVNVKVNVPTEGGGGDKVVYLDITQAVWPEEGFLEMILTLMPILAVKESSRNEIMSSAMAVIDKNAEHFSAIAILSNFRGPVGPDGDLNTNVVIEDFKQFGAFEITKEEFYAIPKSYNIRFTRDEADKNWVANEDLALFFEEAYAYLKANVDEKEYIQLMPYQIASVSYAYGDEEPFTIRIPRGALWAEETYEDGRIEQRIQLDDLTHFFMKYIYPDGTIKYEFEILN